MGNLSADADYQRRQNNKRHIATLDSSVLNDCVDQRETIQARPSLRASGLFNVLHAGLPAPCVRGLQIRLRAEPNTFASRCAMR